MIPERCPLPNFIPDKSSGRKMLMPKKGKGLAGIEEAANEGLPAVFLGKEDFPGNFRRGLTSEQLFGKSPLPA